VTVRKGSRTILNVPSLDLGSRGLVALVGPNGAGKSTLMRVLGGAERDAGGRAMMGGRDLVRLSERERAAAGFVQQHFTPHWNQKVWELLELAEERASAAPGRFSDAAAEFEVDGLLGRRWEGLSGGERARVLLAMALGGRPPLILADEPGAAMDAAHGLRMLEAFRRRAGEALAIVAIHDLSLAVRFFPRVLVMAGGRVAWDGPPEGLRAEGVLDRVFGVRFGRAECNDGFLLYPVSSL
jgi:iron complex transport system ATP-binding protein